MGYNEDASHGATLALSPWPGTSPPAFFFVPSRSSSIRILSQVAFPVKNPQKGLDCPLG